MQVQSTLPTFERIRHIPWIRAFDPQGKEYEILWVSGNAIGLNQAGVHLSLLKLAVDIKGSENSNRLLSIGVTFLKNDDDGSQVFSIDHSSAEFDLEYLIRLSRLKNQSMELHVDQILSDKGLPPWTEVLKQKKKPWKWNNIANVALASVICIIIWWSALIGSTNNVGNIATSLETQEVAIKNGLVVEDIVNEGTQVKKGQVLARLVNAKLFGDLSSLDDKVSEAKKRVASIQRDILAKNIKLKNQTAILKGSEKAEKAYTSLVKSGFMSNLATNPKEEKVIMDRTAVETTSNEISQLKLELDTITSTWGVNFSKADIQKRELKKQIQSLDIRSNCDCIVYLAEKSAEQVRFKLVDPKKPYVIEAAIEQVKVANLKDGQEIYFKLPDNQEYQKGVYKRSYTNINNRIGVSADKFNNSKYTVILVIPEKPIVGGMELIGKPVSLVLKQGYIQEIFTRMQGAIHSITEGLHLIQKKPGSLPGFFMYKKRKIVCLFMTTSYNEGVFYILILTHMASKNPEVAGKDALDVANIISTVITSPELKSLIAGSKDKSIHILDRKISPEDEVIIAQFNAKRAAGERIKEKMLLEQGGFMKDRTGDIIAPISIDSTSPSPNMIVAAQKALERKYSRLSSHL